MTVPTEVDRAAPVVAVHEIEIESYGFKCDVDWLRPG